MALDKNQIAKRIAKEVKEGYFVNLGTAFYIGGQFVSIFRSKFQSENGVLGMGSFL
jgi:3-oxoacid CoA-transferase subunit B